MSGAFSFPHFLYIQPNHHRRHNGDERTDGNAADVLLRLFPPREFALHRIRYGDAVRLAPIDGVALHNVPLAPPPGGHLDSVAPTFHHHRVAHIHGIGANLVDVASIGAHRLNGYILHRLTPEAHHRKHGNQHPAYHHADISAFLVISHITSSIVVSPVFCSCRLRGN